MTTTAVTTKNGQQLARPLKVLVPLINRDVENAEHAGEMFYKSAAEKLWEARSHFDDPKKTDRQAAIDFWDWFGKQPFTFSRTSGDIWMGRWEAENVRGETFSSRNEFQRRTQRGKMRGNVRKTDYHDPVKRILSGIDHDEMRKRAVTAAKEHELERKLANQLIKIGYGVLATKLHPDKGGSHDAMRRLNKVTKELRAVYSRTALTY